MGTAPPPLKSASLHKPNLQPRKTTPTNVSLNLDTLMADLSTMDRQGPMTSTVSSPFLASPIMASTLLYSAGKIAKGADKQGDGAALLSPTSPLVMHPVPVLEVMMDGAKMTETVKQSQVLLEGQARPVAVSAFEDLLFLVRIAKWKVAYSKGEAFDRKEQLPYCESACAAHP